jgi:hypothetical protein
METSHGMGQRGGTQESGYLKQKERKMMKHGMGFVTILVIGLAVLSSGTNGDSNETSKIWVDKTGEYVDILKTAEVVELEDVGMGVTRPWVATMKVGDRMVRGAFKPIKRGRQSGAWESYQAEIAAYELDQMLGLDMVPPTVVREIRGKKGSLQLWIEDCELFKDAEGRPAKAYEWSKELARMVMFDALIFNPDRNAGNFLVSPHWEIILIDHSQAFLNKKNLPKDKEDVPFRFDRKVVENLRGLQVDDIRARFEGILLKDQIEALFARREALLAHIDKLILERGEDVVLF